ncbi:Bifunctional aspartokinase/homoserine dehydrogenase 1, chloroplastic [Sarracenia purpurea var. burkii]
MKKLKIIIQEKSKIWNREVFGNLIEMKGERIQMIERQMNVRLEKVLITAPDIPECQTFGSPFNSMVAVIPNCSILAAVGQKMASTPGVSATLFSALAKANINVRAIAQGCSEYNITVVVKREDCVRALRAVHSRFYLSRTTIAMGIVGPGLIGGTLLDQLRDQVTLVPESM